MSTTLLEGRDGRDRESRAPELARRRRGAWRFRPSARSRRRASRGGARAAVSASRPHTFAGPRAPSCSSCSIPARPAGDRLHVRRRRTRETARRTTRLNGNARSDRPRPAGRAALRRAGRRRRHARCASSARDMRRRSSCSRARVCARTSSTSTSACPRCRSTRASAASPTPTRRRWTCAWTRHRS